MNLNAAARQISKSAINFSNVVLKVVLANMHLKTLPQTVSKMQSSIRKLLLSGYFVSSKCCEHGNDIEKTLAPLAIGYRSFFAFASAKQFSHQLAYLQLLAKLIS